MKLRCYAGRHAAAPGEVRNQGFEFSHCRRCGSDLVRSAHRWRTVPKGFRVVWKQRPGQPAELSARQFLMDLPATGRSLVPSADKVRSRPSDIVVLAALGLRYLLWLAGERLRDWRRRVRQVRATKRQVIYLPSCAPHRAGARP